MSVRNLTREQVIAIYTNKTEKCKELAEKYDVPIHTIKNIRYGVSRKHWTKHYQRGRKKNKLPPEIICSIYTATTSLAQTAKKYGVTKRVVSNVRNGSIGYKYTRELKRGLLYLCKNMVE